ncbi:MAG TPA: TetR/AcrR family transcriptional regulator [Streptosporangiaceae bacterium]|jgi:AcrR family transcriptional regulator
MESTEAPSGGSARTDEIRRAASALFLAKGYAATTMSDIAQAVGILPGSLYHHFDAKESIAVELAQAFNDELAALAVRMRAPDRAGLPPEERVRDLIAAVAEAGRRHAAAVQLRVYDAPTVASDRLRTAMNHHPAALHRVWRSAVNGLAGLPVNPGFDPGMLTWAFEALSVNTSTGEPSDLEAAHLAELACDTLLHGVVVDCPDDATLDASVPLAAAKAEIANWTPGVDGTDTRSQIVAAARREFARRGYDATTIRDIAAASGVRMGTLYRRIDSKESIFTEIVESYAGQLDAALRAALTSPAGSEAETIDAVAYVTAHANRRFHDEFRMMAVTWKRHQENHLPTQKYLSQTADRLAVLAAVLERGQRTGGVRQICPPKDLAGLLRVIVWVPYQAHQRASLRRVHSFLREHVLRGALTPP